MNLSEKEMVMRGDLTPAEKFRCEDQNASRGVGEEKERGTKYQERGGQQEIIDVEALMIF